MCGLDSTDSAHVPTVSYYEHDTEPSGCIKVYSLSTRRAVLNFQQGPGMFQLVARFRTYGEARKEVA
jgi:hypothetical protein